ncbi:MAG: NAD(P)H-binding protein [Candidatus Micrarchaeota archaeon]|nr:NAD(P)H-binding protein [Candidatus Micrarchaeota archaeon]MDE1860009.1 NAD(P)H-binding protein [Candidatus Micrarchaeota archaeon]
MAGRDVVIGGTGFTGKYITKCLLKYKHKVVALTKHVNRDNEFGRKITIKPLDFENQENLVETMNGSRCVFNTYWVRFNYGGSSFDEAVRNSKAIIDACVDAKVKRLVHISVLDPSKNYKYDYFRAKMEVESYIEKSGLSYAILRPALLFGEEDILMNNITYLIRKYGLFFIFGSGEYKVTPTYVGDVAKEAVLQSRLNKNIIEDALGPEAFGFEELVRYIATTIGRPTRVAHLNKAFIPLVSKFLNICMHEPVVTSDEMGLLMDNGLYSDSKPIGSIRFSKWLKERKDTYGTEYHSETKRHFTK